MTVGIGCITQAVTKEVEGQNHANNCNAREQKPWRKGNRRKDKAVSPRIISGTAKVIAAMI